MLKPRGGGKAVQGSSTALEFMQEQKKTQKAEPKAIEQDRERQQLEKRGMQKAQEETTKEWEIKQTSDRRRLFGRVDHEVLEEDLRSQLAQIELEAMDKWQLDVGDSDYSNPLSGRLTWSVSLPAYSPLEPRSKGGFMANGLWPKEDVEAVQGSSTPLEMQEQKKTQKATPKDNEQDRELQQLFRKSPDMERDHEEAWKTSVQQDNESMEKRKQEIEQRLKKRGLREAEREERRKRRRERRDMQKEHARAMKQMQKSIEELKTKKGRVPWTAEWLEEQAKGERERHKGESAKMAEKMENKERRRVSKNRFNTKAATVGSRRVVVCPSEVDEDRGDN
ncbi:uncharacterized protein LOC144865595 [Branchiostoma floridae x Branchiostoma japonicum]